MGVYRRKYGKEIQAYYCTLDHDLFHEHNSLLHCVVSALMSPQMTVILNQLVAAQEKGHLIVDHHIINILDLIPRYIEVTKITIYLLIQLQK